MKFMKPVTVLLMAMSAGISVWFVSVLKPVSMGAYFFFVLWLLSPYAIMSVTLMLWRPENRSSFDRQFVAALVSAGGILLLSDVIFWHKDAQGAISVVLVPVFQCAAFVVLLPIAKWVSRYVRT